MTNASLKARVERHSSAVADALRAGSPDTSRLLRALANEIERAVDSLEKLPQAQRTEGQTLSLRLEVDAGYEEDGFMSQAVQHLEEIRQWLANIPD
jgi:D-serine deaminase-like pyridoxal phosphate-dependent protein